MQELKLSQARTLVRLSIVGVAAERTFSCADGAWTSFENAPRDLSHLTRLGYVERVPNPARETNRHACAVAARLTDAGRSAVEGLPAPRDLMRSEAPATVAIAA